MQAAIFQASLSLEHMLTAHKKNAYLEMREVSGQQVLRKHVVQLCSRLDASRAAACRHGVNLDYAFNNDEEFSKFKCRRTIGSIAA